jgi:transposase
MTYSLDFQEAMIKIYNNLGYTLRNISTFFNISKSALHNWVKNSNNTNNTKEKTESNSKVNIQVLHFLKRSLDHNPFQNLNILAIKIFKKFNILYTKKTISNYLKIIGYSKKKITRRLYNKKDYKEHLQLRKDMKEKLKKLNKNDIICLDECSINRNTHAKYGYCKKNKRLQCNIYLKDLPDNHSLLMAITNKGVCKDGYKLYKNTAINTDIYYEFLEKLIIGKKNKYFLMDNVSFHKSYRIRDLIEKSGNHILFIPPYSPDFNPIEEVFSKLKSFICNNIFPVKKSKDINGLLKKFIKKNDTLDMYYTHAFD